jgi:nicotinate-nucleotide adenylyltransferase
MRIGIFGGTFDPVHLGHLILAELARDHVGLDEVWWVVAHRPPQKEGQPLTRFEARAEMVELAIAGNPAFRVEAMEKERDAPSYTAETLSILRRRHPEHEFSLLVGGDSLAELHLWREPARIVAQASLAVMARPGSPTPSEAELRSRLDLAPSQQLSLTVVPSPQIDIASRALRQAVAAGRTIRYLVPRAVEVYIQQHRLYLGNQTK